MKPILLPFLLSILLVPSSLALLERAPLYGAEVACDTERLPSKIKLLLTAPIASSLVDVAGKYRLYDPYQEKLISHRHLGKRQKMEATAEGMKWGEEFPGIYQLKIVPDDLREPLFIDGVPYRGAVYFYAVGDQIAIVNEVPIEEYLEATLRPLFPHDEPHELLAAIAIAVRSSAYFAAAHPLSSFWSVDATKVGYRSALPLHSEEGLAMHRALAATRHMVLSTTGPYERVVTPLPCSWQELPQLTPYQEKIVSQIDWKEARRLAQRGDNGAMILKRAFPSALIQLLSPARDLAL